MKLVTWNVNGLRAALDKGFNEFVNEYQPDILCLQESKVLPEQIDLTHLKDYEIWYNPAQKKGYSGTMLLTKIKPQQVTTGFQLVEHDGEGRVITAEFADCWVVNCYTPNSQRELLRLDYRMIWDRVFRDYLQGLARSKPVLFCGDLNVSHQEIDLANPRSNRMNAGFTDQERAGFTDLLSSGFLDVFRMFDPSPGKYTWWTYRSDARERNIGWRLDYWGASEILRPHLKSCTILPHILGSDHCPVLLETKPTLKF
jgi:exodeoxyribonuclease III